ncbi:MAG: DNRLRE domain-containing protein [Thermoanaerobaculia bacterium]|nr:DNRLRE domain-containing protein [Thermoanaerobaculia bacterium]
MIHVYNPPVEVTFVSTGSEDGWLRESSENSDIGGSRSSSGTNGSALRVGDSQGDRQYKSVVSFDTSSIPEGATILSATLRLRRGGLSGTNPFGLLGSCLVDIQSNGFSGNVALENSDFEAAAAAVGAASMSDAPANLDWSEGTLNAAGLVAIDTAGSTQMRVYFSLDDNDDGGNDYMGFYSGSTGTADRRPQLVITYRE